MPVKKFVCVKHRTPECAACLETTGEKFEYLETLTPVERLVSAITAFEGRGQSDDSGRLKVLLFPYQLQILESWASFLESGDSDALIKQRAHLKVLLDAEERKYAHLTI